MAPWHCSAWRAVCIVSVENGGSSFVEGHITVVSLFGCTARRWKYSVTWRKMAAMAAPGLGAVSKMAEYGGCRER